MTPISDEQLDEIKDEMVGTWAEIKLVQVVNRLRQQLADAQAVIEKLPRVMSLLKDAKGRIYKGHLNKADVPLADAIQELNAALAARQEGANDAK
jgi:hypothetical protein